LLEQELHGLDGMREDLARIVEATEFNRQLRTPHTGQIAGAPASPAETGR
jgi:hypothetical protein